LAREPAARPSLSDTASALTTRPVVRARRWPLLAGACMVVGGAAFGWRAIHGGRPVAPPARIVIGVEPIALAMTGENLPAGADDAVGNAIATVGATTGMKIVGPEDLFTVLKLVRTGSGPDRRTLAAGQLASAEHELGVTL